MDYVRSVDSSQCICQHFLVVFLKWTHQAILLPNSLYMYIHYDTHIHVHVRYVCRFLIGLPSSPSSGSSSSTASSSSSIVRSASGSSGGGGVNEKTSPSPWVYVTIDGQHISCKLYVYSVRDACLYEFLDDEVHVANFFVCTVTCFRCRRGMLRCASSLEVSGFVFINFDGIHVYLSPSHPSLRLSLSLSLSFPLSLSLSS